MIDDRPRSAHPGPSAQTKLVRRPERAVYDRAAIDAILDEGLVCHVAFIADDLPVVIPTLYARIGDRLYLHGSAASRTARALEAGMPVCLSVTLLDGIVLARSADRHSANYRSVMLFGRAELVTERAEKLAALMAFVDHLVPGRAADVRPPSWQEQKAVSVLFVSIDAVSAKVRMGGPRDAEDDLTIRSWAGVIPLELRQRAPEEDTLAPVAVAPPAYVVDYFGARRLAVARRQDERATPTHDDTTSSSNTPTEQVREVSP